MLITRDAISLLLILQIRSLIEVAMNHRMNLWNNSFFAIQSGSKTVEMRLNDDKRRLLCVGDTITFINVDTQKELAVKVIKTVVYKDFFELYKNYNKIQIGYSFDEVEDPADMYNYYSIEEIDKYGALAIEIELI